MYNAPSTCVIVVVSEVSTRVSGFLKNFLRTGQRSVTLGSTNLDYLLGVTSLRDEEAGLGSEIIRRMGSSLFTYVKVDNDNRELARLADRGFEGSSPCPQVHSVPPQVHSVPSKT